MKYERQELIDNMEDEIVEQGEEEEEVLDKM